MHYKRICALAACILSCLLFSPTNYAWAQSGTQSVVAASALKELPLKAWGTYHRAHLAPTCLVNLLLGQQFQFPLVISQQQAAIVPQRTVTLDGRIKTGLASVILQRRAMGLSSVQAKNDDLAPTGPLAALNRRAQITDADGDGLLWSCRMAFAPAALAQTYATLKDAGANGAGAANIGTNNGANTPPNGGGAWGAGEATVDCFPAFAEPDGEGLLLRVTLLNRSTAPQTYCVDLLGGMDTPGPAFAPEDFLVRVAPDLASAVVQHGKCPAVFALAAPGPPYHARCYRVSEAYFAPTGAIAHLDAVGASLPNGLLSFNAASPANGSDNPKDAKPKPGGKKRKAGKGETDDADASQESGANAPGAVSLPGPPARETGDETQYALTRVDNIAVAPGQSVQFFLSVGVGRDADTARSSAQTLLGVAGNADGSGQSGAYAAARKAHDAARFKTGQPGMERLMAQSLANTPNVEAGRLGVGTRQTRPGRANGLYDPARDALMAVGWTNYRPFFAAAQLNAWFQTKSDPEETSGVPVRNPRAIPPTNLFALWELYERTHDRALLKRYYPYARRRYLELLAAGRVGEEAWRFGWPATAQDAVFRPGSVPPQTTGSLSTQIKTEVKQEVKSELKADGKTENAPLAAPDYAAYVVRAARLMQTIGELSDQPAPETRQYAIDALETARVMNTQLWDANLKTYVAAPSAGSAAPKGRADTLAGLLPLIGGMDAQTPEQRAGLLQTLTDPAAFWSPAGLRSVSLASPAYRAEEGASGAVRFGLNWLFWKALLDLGETDTARKLASNLLQGYAKAQSASDACPEWLNGDDGAAGGAGDYAGDACALLAMYTAYHQPGAFTGGWNVHFLDSGYNAQKDALHLVARRLQPTGVVRVVCVMGKPNGKYLLTGAVAGTQTADAGGTLTLTLPQDNTTLVIDVSPAG